MIDPGHAFLEKAAENLAAATSEHAQGRYNSCASRAYYACFQAAIYALLQAGVQPSGRPQTWGHDFVQAQFNGHLIARRKMYSSVLRDVLRQSFAVRAMAELCARARERGPCGSIAQAIR